MTHLGDRLILSALSMVHSSVCFGALCLDQVNTFDFSRDRKRGERERPTKGGGLVQARAEKEAPTALSCDGAAEGEGAQAKQN